MAISHIIIREADESDLHDVMHVETEAFGYEKEAILVSQLLEDESARPTLSLLAVKGDEAVGHILFTKAAIEGTDPSPLIYLLAPLAVKPQHQKEGIGGMLIREGLKKLKDRGVERVFVLGHMDYYPRFGFKPDAGSMGFAAPYPIPEEFAGAWMVYSLGSPEAKVTGRIVCADALNKPEHWRE